MPRFKEMPMHPSQVLLFAQSVEETLSAKSDVRTFADVMECMDYSRMELRCSEMGCPPYPPKVMAKIQSSVDTENQIIVAMKLTQSENDHGYLPDMVEETESNVGLTPDVSLADTGYSDEGTLKWLDESGHNALMPSQENAVESKRSDLFASKCFFRADDKDVLVCPAGRELERNSEYKIRNATYIRYAATGSASCSFRNECAGKSKCSRHVDISVVADQRRQMKEKLNSEEGRQLYQKRQETSEPVFGRIKENMGLRRFLLWGYTGAIAEAALTCMAHNVSKCAASIAARRYLAKTRASCYLSIIVISLPVSLVCWFKRMIGSPARQTCQTL